MTKTLRFLLFPFALLYGGITFLRNGFYRVGIFKSSKFSVPVINVGNLSAGGTGKTPHTEYLIRLLKKDHKLFTLSRGFGRKERGFIIADETATARKIGDEPLQYHLKFGNEIGVAVEANRVLGVMDICRNEPETNLILLDDAFQHRAIYAGLNLLITTYQNPFYTDYLLPVGNLRELRHGSNRADLIIVSKCPEFDLVNKAAVIKKIAPKSHQNVFFSKIVYGALYKMFEQTKKEHLSKENVILVTGIAKANPLVEQLEKNNTILHHFEYNDHYNFKGSDILEIHKIFDKFVDAKPVIITTEKDAMCLKTPEFENEMANYPWFYQSIEIEIDNAKEFDNIVKTYVEENS